ncbi:MAG TPA: RagB/SusD family nutrient uptake outer membrane protein [Ohtaekwangia sp.]|uniref:RagB/SusD family nutrient uptake outer membrane protein n=1 Tax=Ohtaekwangia sp. TaxID=2066019 RepID=UPI002F958670
MKKILFIITVLFVASCGQELDVKPTIYVASDVAKKTVDLLLTGAYSLIGSGGGQPGALYSTDLLLNADLLASEDYMEWRGTFSDYNEISRKTISTTNGIVARMWTKGYQAINQANIILESLENVEKSDQDYYRGQALFIRGIVHFELLRFWMEPSTNLGIPIMTTSTQDFPEIKYPKRESIADSYTAILADLTEAKTLLAGSTNFANSYTVAAFLARVYLQKGDYANAFAQANDVIENGGFSLVNSVEEAFNGTSSETIFEIEQTTLNNAGTANDGLTTFYACDPLTPGSAGRGDVQIQSDFLDLYEADDKRKTLLIYDGTCNKATTTSAKWHDPYANMPIIRLSEMFLIRAETNIRLGQPGDVDKTPLDDVNAIRTKANASKLKTVTLEDVLLERELELAFEGHRIHDFKRLGKVTESADYTESKFIFPVPQIDRNTNPNLEQNSYYQ